MPAANTNNPFRCEWAKTDLSIAYHDREWGVPVHDDRTLFEFLILEGAQAGLSWEIILRKRDNYRRAFDNFDPAKIAKYDERKIAKLLADEGIIRNRLKIASAVQNAKAFLIVQKEFGSFDKYVWRFVNGKPLKRKGAAPIHARTTDSDALSADLSRRGFKFVGSTICYSFMQAVGLVNDHDTKCFGIVKSRSELSIGPRWRLSFYSTQKRITKVFRPTRFSFSSENSCEIAYFQFNQSR